MWYLLSHYFREQDLDNFIECGLVFVTHQHHDERWSEIMGALNYILTKIPQTTQKQKDQIAQVLMANKA